MWLDQAGLVSRIGVCIVGNKAGWERKSVCLGSGGKMPWGPLWVGLWELIRPVSKQLNRVSRGRGIRFGPWGTTGRNARHFSMPQFTLMGQWSLWGRSHLVKASGRRMHGCLAVAVKFVLGNAQRALTACSLGISYGNYCYGIS